MQINGKNKNGTEYHIRAFLLLKLLKTVKIYDIITSNIRGKEGNYENHTEKSDTHDKS